MERPFEFVDHTADYAMRAWGEDFRRLLENAAQGLLELIANVEGAVPERSTESRARSLWLRCA